MDHHDILWIRQRRYIHLTLILTRLGGQIFEKYHAQLVGQPGGGGEYVVQEGFGWTNGVILWCLAQFPGIQIPQCPAVPVVPVCPN